ncbi:class I SAM-dependent methyltransferase [Gemmatimonas sp.]|uniref:class I SAM-dependent methyltransferase n=1 Tax=Gemmatimonas sp. TaxID=1962908 RepID=UPI00286AB08A|nr:class I SAM-dependent methyltransferase [Gemmatimonas sp.]
MSASSDDVWEQKYRRGHRERYPWDAVVSFLFRQAPRDRERRDVRVLEVGFGTGNNLWCAAREGFSVAGVERSPEAVATARRWFEAEGLEGDLREGDLTDLPFADAYFDLAIDRAAITCVGRADAARAVRELARVLRPGGRLFTNVYADHSTSASSGVRGADGRQHEITAGTLTGVGPICFYSEADVRALLDGWELLSVEQCDGIARTADAPVVHGEWRIIASRPP